MFRAKRNKQAPQVEAPEQQPVATTTANGYNRVELPTFVGRKRKVVVYTSDAQGRIIKTIKK